MVGLFTHMRERPDYKCLYHKWYWAVCWPGKEFLLKTHMLSHSLSHTLSLSLSHTHTHTGAHSLLYWDMLLLITVSASSALCRHSALFLLPGCFMRVSVYWQWSTGEAQEQNCLWENHIKKSSVSLYWEFVGNERNCSLTLWDMVFTLLLLSQIVATESVLLIML